MNNTNNDNPIDPIPRRDIFRDGNIGLIDRYNIMTFTEDDIIAALDNYQLDFLEALLLRHPDMMNNITIGNDVYGYVLTPPRNATNDTTVRMYAFLMNKLEIPPPQNIGVLLFHHWRMMKPWGELYGDWRGSILQILRLTRSAGYPITPTNLYNLNSLFSWAMEYLGLPENELSRYILEEILTDDEFRRCIRDYIQSRPPNVPYGHLVHERQSEEDGGDITGPLVELLWTLIYDVPNARLLAVVLPELTSRDLFPIFDFFRESLEDNGTADPATYALLINHYPRPPVVSGPVFPEEENTYWLGLKSRADAFNIAADRDVAERLAINEALAARDSKRYKVGPADYTDEQNRARERAIAPASSSTAIRTAFARNRLGPSPLIPLRNVTARERDSGLEICAICLQNMGSSTLIQPAGTHFGCKHTFCVDCTRRARLQACPYCREPSKIDPLPRSPRADFLFSHC
jgi:hypothetical protein